MKPQVEACLAAIKNVFLPDTLTPTYLGASFDFFNEQVKTSTDTIGWSQTTLAGHILFRGPNAQQHKTVWAEVNAALFKATKETSSLVVR